MKKGKQSKTKTRNKKTVKMKVNRASTINSMINLCLLPKKNFRKTRMIGWKRVQKIISKAAKKMKQTTVRVHVKYSLSKITKMINLD
jgi:hypothetical protein